MENGQQKADAKESEESSRGKGEASSNDDEASRRGYLTNDEQLDYGSAGSDLSDLVEEELRRVLVDFIKEKELSVPCQRDIDVSDKIESISEERIFLCQSFRAHPMTMTMMMMMDQQNWEQEAVCQGWRAERKSWSARRDAA